MFDVILESQKAFLDYKKQKNKKVKKSGFFQRGYSMVLVKKIEILPCFYFLQKTASKMHLAIFYKVTKLFLNLVHDSDCIKKNYKELQAIPSFHGIHRVEFLVMLLILQFHG